MNWSALLEWAIRHAPDVPAFVQLVLAAVRAEGLFARMKAIGELYAAIQAILADFPMPTEQLYGADVEPMLSHLTSSGVSTEDAAEFCQAVEA